MHADRIDSTGATAIQLTLSPSEAREIVDILSSELDRDTPRDDDLLRSLTTRIGVVAAADRSGQVLLTERDYVALDAATHAAESDIAKVLENNMMPDANADSHRTTVDESELPR